MRLAQQRIEALSDTIKSQNTEIARLQKQLEEAVHQVKDIAVAAVGSSKKEPAPPVKPIQ